MTGKRLQGQNSFIAPNEARRIAKLSVGNSAEHVILEDLRGGLLVAVASHWSDRFQGQEPNVIGEPTPIPASSWDNLYEEAEFWTAGTATFVSYDGVYGNRTVRCTGILFLEKMIKRRFPALDPEPEKPQPPAITAPAQAIPAKHAGGAPKKDYWEELWIEMCRQIYTAELDLREIKVTKIATAMMDWSHANYPEDPISDSTAKRYARRLAEALRREGS